MRPTPTRTETDSFGPIEVPADALWAAQTERSRRFFAIGGQRMPLAIIHALAGIKQAAAQVNRELGLLDAEKAGAIENAAAQVAEGGFDGEFPLSVWQTGSGTQSNMNVNEVIANLASKALAANRDGMHPIHPNDDVNLGQSSNDVFPTAMHIAAILATVPLLASLGLLRSALKRKSLEFRDIVKVGRTHLPHSRFPESLTDAGHSAGATHWLRPCCGDRAQGRRRRNQPALGRSRVRPCQRSAIRQLGAACRNAWPIRRTLDAWGIRHRWGCLKRSVRCVNRR